MTTAPKPMKLPPDVERALQVLAQELKPGQCIELEVAIRETTVATVLADGTDVTPTTLKKVVIFAPVQTLALTGKVAARHKKPAGAEG